MINSRSESGLQGLDSLFSRATWLLPERNFMCYFHSRSCSWLLPYYGSGLASYGAQVWPAFFLLFFSSPGHSKRGLTVLSLKQTDNTLLFRASTSPNSKVIAQAPARFCYRPSCWDSCPRRHFGKSWHRCHCHQVVAVCPQIKHWRR